MKNNNGRFSSSNEIDFQPLKELKISPDFLKLLDSSGNNQNIKNKQYQQQQQSKQKNQLKQHKEEWPSIVSVINDFKLHNNNNNDDRSQIFDYNDNFDSKRLNKILLSDDISYKLKRQGKYYNKDQPTFTLPYNNLLNLNYDENDNGKNDKIDASLINDNSVTVVAKGSKSSSIKDDDENENGFNENYNDKTKQLKCLKKAFKYHEINNIPIDTENYVLNCQNMEQQKRNGLGKIKKSNIKTGHQTQFIPSISVGKLIII